MNEYSLTMQWTIVSRGKSNCNITNNWVMYRSIPGSILLRSWRVLLDSVSTKVEMLPHLFSLFTYFTVHLTDYSCHQLLLNPTISNQHKLYTIHKQRQLNACNGINMGPQTTCNLLKNEVNYKITGLLAYKSLVYLHMNHLPTCI